MSLAAVPTDADEKRKYDNLVVQYESAITFLRKLLCAPHTFSLVLLFGCCHFGSDAKWRKILSSDGVMRVVTVTAGIELLDVPSLGRQSCMTTLMEIISI